MCSYNKEDWTVLAKMAEVRKPHFANIILILNRVANCPLKYTIVRYLTITTEINFGCKLVFISIEIAFKIYLSLRNSIVEELRTG